MTRPGSRRRDALTVVEVLVALAVFALLSAVTAGLFTAALRLQAEAAAGAARIDAFAPLAAGVAAGVDGGVDGGAGDATPVACSDATDPDRDAGPCLRARTRCRARADGRVVCDGTGPLRRSDWGWTGADRGSGRALTAWRWDP